MVNLALTISPNLKLHRRSSGELLDKWIIRAAFDDLLPNGIVSRQKVSFAEGSGTLDVLWIVLSNVARSLDPDKQDERAIEKQERSQELGIYHALIAETFGASAPILENVGRWKRESS
jgi:asparagine synthase (glutamine-hydrolysing)